MTTRPVTEFEILSVSLDLTTEPIMAIVQTNLGYFVGEVSYADHGPHGTYMELSLPDFPNQKLVITQSATMPIAPYWLVKE